MPSAGTSTSTVRTYCTLPIDASLVLHVVSGFFDVIGLRTRCLVVENVLKPNADGREPHFLLFLRALGEGIAKQISFPS
jgi:hypothetical protein